MKLYLSLADWVNAKHLGQMIKDTGNPYFTHVVAVAEMARPATLLGYEIGLCHDLLEDTSTSERELFDTLISFNYNIVEASYITSRVVELTDVFTSAAFPHLSKKVRKEKEAFRLCNGSEGVQTVKYCDLADNIKWVLQHDQEHAMEYLKRKRKLLLTMNQGNPGLHLKVLEIIEKEMVILP